ncbi:phage tail terminator-like protein [Solidesulfovibrio alcoholivorans]|uniref:phage tail terminator-like protein n=1 Tax=Solidesulfovibrio alcoholivorans TaxID=81406 RepID=UPI0005C17293|nr:phage tail terminator-like protein [Solidesulfovibrio alcoholivorans]
MTPDAIIRAVQTYFKTNWTATPVAYDNLAFTPPTDGKWVRCTVLPGKAFSEEVGPDASGHRIGVVKVQVFTPSGVGVQVGWALAAQVEALFKGKDVGEVFFAPGDDLSQEGPSTVDSGVTNGNQQHTVTCPFWAWDGE